MTTPRNRKKHPPSRQRPARCSRRGDKKKHPPSRQRLPGRRRQGNKKQHPPSRQRPARYADLVQLRWDEDYCWVHPLFVRFLLQSRKNEQYESCFLNVARPLDPTRRGAFHAIAEMRELCGRTGFVLPHISALGVVDTTRPMSYKKYVRHLRHALTKLGVDPAIARTFAGQSPRAGAATAAARAGARPEMIANAAGVKSIDWLLTYNQASATGYKNRGPWVFDLVFDGCWGGSEHGGH